MTTSREIRLAARPEGVPRPSDFALVEVDVPAPGDGQVLIRNAFTSVDPYMRVRMSDVKSYMPLFQLDEALDGGGASAQTRRAGCAKAARAAPGAGSAGREGLRSAEARP